MKAYQFKIAIKNSKPPIWRRCIVPAGLTFTQLSIILNEVMGWSGYHLFEVEFYHLQLRIAEDDGFFEEFGYDGYDLAEASNTFINEYMEKQAWFTYTYDFGDDWQHRVTIERVITDYEYNYPQVIKYKGVCPMEDCGGIDGYYECLEILENENHPEHNEKSQWVSSIGYQPEYDMVSVNESLKENYAVTFGKGEKRQQSKIYEAMFAGERGLTASKAAKNTNKPVRSSRHQLDDSFQRFADMFKSMYLENQYPPLPPWGIGEDTLEAIFDCYDKKDLMEIAKLHGMKGCSKYNKDELITAVADYIMRPEIMERYFSCLRDNEIKGFEKAIKQKTPYVMESEEVFDRIGEGGYIGCPCKNEVVIPGSVTKVYKKFNSESFNQIRERRSFLLDCFIAAGILYGVAPISVIAKMYNQNMPASKGRDSLTPASIIMEYENIPAGLLDCAIHDNYFMDSSLLEDNTYKKLEQMQGNKNFYIPTAIEIRDIAEKGYLPNDRHLKKLITFLTTRLNISMEAAEDIGAEIQMMICGICEMQDIFDMLDESGIEPDNYAEMNQFVSIINELWNHTRMMLNRGFKPSELMNGGSTQYPFADNMSKPKPEGTKVINLQEARKKIYPNAPCPCGSGKKYKHCCQKKL